jgi:MoaD family protein
VTVKFLAAAREKAGVREETLQVEGATTVLEILKALGTRHGEKLKEYLFDHESGSPRPYLNFLLNGRSVSQMGGFSAEITEDATMIIFPPTSGG